MSMPTTPSDSALDAVIVPRTRDLGDNFEVRRALPSAQRRMVGPFVFLDQMGPTVFSAGRGIDVRPHPHIGLATVTYLFDGEIVHRDSVGSVQPIRPGEVNWMTAGRGIVHSERTAPEVRAAASSLFGLQCWVGLPQQHEEAPPSFSHTPAAELPSIEGEGVTACIVAGELYERRSPVPTLSPLCYVDVTLRPGARLDVPAAYPEQALCIVDGRIDLGRDGVFDTGRLLVLKSGAHVTVAAAGGKPARLMVLGGEPLDGPRYLSWNFVSSSRERLVQAADDWRAQRFPRVPGETEFVPLPVRPGGAVHYP
jgi:redox-sensitive bicupin YhaK (pirin superfamily)